MGFPKSTLVARGANTQLDLSCVSAPPATNVDFCACFAKRLFKSSSISFFFVQARSEREFVCGHAEYVVNRQNSHPSTEFNRMSRDVSSTVNVH